MLSHSSYVQCMIVADEDEDRSGTDKQQEASERVITK
jgi:hypothetical protein